MLNFQWNAFDVATDDKLINNQYLHKAMTH